MKKIVCLSVIVMLFVSLPSFALAAGGNRVPHPIREY